MFWHHHKDALVRHARRFARDTEGNFAVIFAVCLLPLLLMIGMATDFTYASRVRNDLQVAVDAATLAATKAAGAGETDLAELKRIADESPACQFHGRRIQQHRNRRYLRSGYRRGKGGGEDQDQYRLHEARPFRHARRSGRGGSGRRRRQRRGGDGARRHHLHERVEDLQPEDRGQGPGRHAARPLRRGQRHQGVHGALCILGQYRQGRQGKGHRVRRRRLERLSAETRRHSRRRPRTRRPRQMVGAVAGAAAGAAVGAAAGIPRPRKRPTTTMSSTRKRIATPIPA